MLGSAGLSLLVSLPIAFVVGGLLGVLLEVTLLRRMYHRPLDTLLVTWGVALILQQLARDIFGTAGCRRARPVWLSGRVEVLGVRLPAAAAVHPRALPIAAFVALSAGAASSRRWAGGSGRRCRTATWPRRAGISTRATDRLTFFIGSGPGRGRRCGADR